jgi:hypothetical protein
VSEKQKIPGGSLQIFPFERWHAAPLALRRDLRGRRTHRAIVETLPDCLACAFAKTLYCGLQSSFADSDQGVARIATIAARGGLKQNFAAAACHATSRRDHATRSATQ